MTDYSRLKCLAEAMPDLDWDSEFEGHEQTGFCTVFVNPFEIDGEQHEGPTLIERCTAEQAEFISGAKVAVLELIAENERLHASLLGYQMGAKAEAEEADRLRGEVKELRRDAERMSEATAFVRQLCDAAGTQPSVATGYLSDILSAMTKEARL